MSYMPDVDLVPDKVLIDTVEVVAAGAGAGQLNAPVTSFDFGAAGDGREQAPISGLGVMDYQAEIDLFSVLNGRFWWQPNGLATNQHGVGLSFAGGVADFQIGELVVAQKLSNPVTGKIVLKFTARDGQIRGFQCWSGQREDGSVDPDFYRGTEFFGTWEAAGTPLSSFRFFSDVAGAIGAGTLASLYELRRRF